MTQTNDKFLCPHCKRQVDTIQKIYATDDGEFKILGVACEDCRVIMERILMAEWN